MAPSTRSKKKDLPQSQSGSSDTPEAPDNDRHQTPSRETKHGSSVNSSTKPATRSGRQASRRYKDATAIPVYTIDLSLPPEKRYVELANDFADRIRELTSLFDEVVHDISPKIPVSFVSALARVLLRGLHDREETEELRGISKATGVELYLLFCFNTLLDLFMGCTSGGVRVKDGDDGTRMLHFRTLDWGMDSLRRVIVQLNFVRRPGGEVIASSITYAGYTGVLTGLRKNFSVSLNFRPTHNNSGSFFSNIRFASNQVLVLLGLRQSISSHLRSLLLSQNESDVINDEKIPPDHASPSSGRFEKLVKDFSSKTTTAAYVIVSDGKITSVVEKDRVTAEVRNSSSFIVATNHDEAIEADREHHQNRFSQDFENARNLDSLNLSDEYILEESMDRKECIVQRWRNECQSQQRRSNSPINDENVAITEKQLLEWTMAWPTANECTHYAAILDPARGELFWSRRWIEPIRPPS